MDSYICPKAHKRKITNGGKLIGEEYKCNTACVMCHGTAKVTDCPFCAGCGLREGGQPCITCQCTGKRPTYTTKEAIA